MSGNRNSCFGTSCERFHELFHRFGDPLRLHIESVDDHNVRMSNESNDIAVTMHRTDRDEIKSTISVDKFDTHIDVPAIYFCAYFDRRYLQRVKNEVESLALDNVAEQSIVGLLSGLSVCAGVIRNGFATASEIQDVKQFSADMDQFSLELLQLDYNDPLNTMDRNLDFSWVDDLKAASDGST